MKKLPFASLRIRLATLIFLAMMPVLALTIVTYVVEQDLVVTHIHHDVMRIARFAAGEQEQLIEQTRQLLVALSKLPEIVGQDGKTCSRILSDIRQEYPRYANIGVIKPDGQLFCIVGRKSGNVSFEDQSWFRHSMVMKDFAIGVTRNGGTLDISYPVVDDADNIKAVLYAAIDMGQFGQLDQLARQVQLPVNAEFLLVSRNGLVLAHLPDHDRWAGRSYRGMAIVEAMLAKGQGVSELPGLDGVVRLYAFTPLSSIVDTGFYIGVGVPKWGAYSEAQKVLLQHFAGLGIGILVALLAVWFGSEALILKRVKALAGAVERLSEGDMTARSGLPFGSGELDGLARAFDEMAETLERRALQLREAEAKYRTLVEQIPAITYAANLDESRSTLYISPQVFKILGFFPDEWVADRDLWIKQIHPEDLQFVKKTLADCCLPRSSTSFHCEYRIFSKDGRQLWFTDEAVRVRSEGDATQYLQGIMIDISEQRQAQEQLMSYQKQLRSLASQLLLAEERERRRIASDLHDHVGQALAMSRIKLGILMESAPSGDYSAIVEEVRGLVVQAIKDTRSLIFKISSPILYELGLEAALEWLAEETQQKYDIQVKYRDNGGSKPLDDDVRVLLFQAVGELLVNVVKHSQAGTVLLSSRTEGDCIVIDVEDDGIGFEVEQVAARLSGLDGFGLFSIRERLNHIEGKLEINSELGRGTRVTLAAMLKKSSSVEQ